MRLKFKPLVAMVISVIFLLAFIPLAFGQDSASPDWAIEGNYAQYNANYEFSANNIGNISEKTFSGSGTKTWKVETVKDKSANVKITKDLSWGQTGAPPKYPTADKEEQWYFDIALTHFILAQKYLEQLQQGSAPSQLGNSYQGESSVEALGSRLPTFHIKERENAEERTVTKDFYYDQDTGILVKYRAQAEVTDSDNGTTESMTSDSILSLKDTNVIAKESGGRDRSPDRGKEPSGTTSNWVLAAVIFLAIVIAAVFVLFRKGQLPDLQQLTE